MMNWLERILNLVNKHIVVFLVSLKSCSELFDRTLHLSNLAFALHLNLTNILNLQWFPCLSVLWGLLSLTFNIGQVFFLGKSEECLEIRISNDIHSIALVFDLDLDVVLVAICLFFSPFERLKLFVEYFLQVYFVC